MAGLWYNAENGGGAGRGRKGRWHMEKEIRENHAGDLLSLDQFMSSGIFAYKTADDALRAYVKEALKQQNGGKGLVHREAAVKQLLATLAAVAVMFIDIAVMMLYHRNIPVFLGILAVAGLALWFAHRRVNTSAALVGKMAAMPDADVQAVLAGELDQMVSSRWVTLGKAAMGVIAVVALIVLFAEPHMIFEDNASGCGLRFYTWSFRPVANVVVPDTYEGKPVTAIRGNVFQGLGAIRTVKLPKGITEIRGYTFDGCRNLQSINIPQGVTRIGGHAFYGCSSLKDVKFPSSLEEIGSSAFRRCASLSKVRIPAGCNVNSRAFKESPTRVERY